MVVFTDDFGKLYRIEGEKVESPVPDDDSELRGVLGNIFDGLVIAGYKAAAPDAAVVEHTYLPDQRGGAFLAVVTLPGASKTVPGETKLTKLLSEWASRVWANATSSPWARTCERVTTALLTLFLLAPI